MYLLPRLPAVLKYMQFMEDYSEPMPSVFYQTPQSESIYEQRNRKRFQEVYGLSDSFSSSDETLPPPALPPKQRQLVRARSLPTHAVHCLILTLARCLCNVFLPPDSHR